MQRHDTNQVAIATIVCVCKASHRPPTSLRAIGTLATDHDLVRISVQKRVFQKIRITSAETLPVFQYRAVTGRSCLLPRCRYQGFPGMRVACLGNVFPRNPITRTVLARRQVQTGFQLARMSIPSDVSEFARQRHYRNQSNAREGHQYRDRVSVAVGLSQLRGPRYRTGCLQLFMVRGTSHSHPDNSVGSPYTATTDPAAPFQKGKPPPGRTPILVGLNRSHAVAPGWTQTLPKAPAGFRPVS